MLWYDQYVGTRITLVSTGGVVGRFRRAPKIAMLPPSRNGVYLFLRRYADDLPFAKDRSRFENGRVLYPREAVEDWIADRCNGVVAK
jgi:hypothetical protein